MREQAPFLTGTERTFQQGEVIVSKTDPVGRITYANLVFQHISGYREEELLGQPHNILRHPDMPRCVFKLLWDTISAGQEIFAYVVNRAKNGDHYWVFAHITPSFDPQGKITGYHSNRRSPLRDPIVKITDLYRILLVEETRHTDPKQGLAASSLLLATTLEKIGRPYDEFIFSL